MNEQGTNRDQTIQSLLEEMWSVMAFTAKTKGPRFSTVEALVAMLILEVRQLRRTLSDSDSEN